MAKTRTTSPPSNNHHSCHAGDALSLRLGPAQQQQGRRTTTSTEPPAAPRRARRSRSNPVPEGKSATIPAPYPWARDRRAKIQSMEYLMGKGISRITGELVCRKCSQKQEVSLDLADKFREVAGFIVENKYSMKHRAPDVWKDPRLPDCPNCGHTECMKPVVMKKRNINWLFLLLGQWIGCCKLWDLKYFCKHAMIHRTGAKDRVLYLTYLNVCKQLDPSGPFDA